MSSASPFLPCLQRLDRAQFLFCPPLQPPPAGLAFSSWRDAAFNAAGSLAFALNRRLDFLAQLFNSHPRELDRHNCFFRPPALGVADELNVRRLRTWMRGKPAASLGSRTNAALCRLPMVESKFRLSAFLFGSRGSAPCLRGRRPGDSGNLQGDQGFALRQYILISVTTAAAGINP